MLTSNSFFHIISVPTRVTKSSATLIDHILTNSLHSNITPGVVRYDISDRFPIYAIFSNFPKKQTSKIYYRRDFRNYDNENLANNVESSLSIFFFNSDCITPSNYDKTFETFIAIIKTEIDKLAPVTKLSRRKSKLALKPWIAKGVWVSIKKKQKLYKKAYPNGSPLDIFIYKKYSNCLTRVKKAAKRMHYIKQFENCKYDQLKTWKIIRELVYTSKLKKNDSFALLNVNNREIDDAYAISEAFNEFFCSVADKIQQTSTNPVSEFHYKTFLTSPILPSIYLDPPTPRETYNIIVNLKTKKSTGADEISSFFVRKLASVLSPYLCFLFTFAFEFGIFPNCLKIARVVPIHKAGSKKEVTNYRPISLLTCFSKILEKLIQNRLLKFCHKNNIFYNRQFGFRKNHSTIQAINDIVSQCYDNLNCKKDTCLILLDIRKAFDTVNHNILLSKLNHYGIRGVANDLLHSYLSNRTQFVDISDSISSTRLVANGVPQGSILGPILFLIFINDLANALKTSPQLFADDTCLLISDTSLEGLERLCNSELLLVCERMTSNRLALNPYKTQALLISHRKINSKTFSLAINNIPINITPTAKYLGIEIDSSLSFTNQINKIEAKISTALGILFRLQHFAPKQIVISIYYSLVYPHLCYGIIVWGSTSNYLLNRLQVLQKKCLRVIKGWQFKQKIKPLYEKYDFLNINQIHFFKVAKIMYYSVHRLQPAIFDDYFKFVSSVSRHRLRSVNDDKLYLPFFKNKSGQNSIKFKGVKIWNSLPKNIRTLPLVKFKKSCHQYAKNYIE